MNDQIANPGGWCSECGLRMQQPGVCLNTQCSAHVEEQEKVYPKPEVKITKSGSPHQVIEVQNLIVSKAPLRRVAIGTVNDFVSITARNHENIKAIIWNERGIALLLNRSDEEIFFVPEFHPASRMFFTMDEKRRSGFDDDAGIRVWEGEYAPVQFQKSKLIQFLKKYSEYFDPEMEQAIKNLRVTQKRSSETEMLSLDDDDNTRTVEEKTKTTNLPKQFAATMPLFDGISVELEFEAEVKPRKDRYGSDSKTNVIEIRVTNAREAIRSVMKDVLGRLSDKVPKYYGRMHVETKRDRW